MRRPFAVAAPLLLAAACLAQAPDDDLLVADFEGKDYGAWKVTGTAFGTGPARGTLPGQMPVTGYLGQGLVNSFLGGDAATGTLTSPAFKVERRYINFLVGGGKHPDKTCINLLVGGRRVRTATGPNDRPGGSEHLDWHTWDVGDLRGKDAVIEIVDDHVGGWGHINVDHIVQSNRPRMAVPVRRDLAIAKRHLHLPVKNGAPMRRMKFVLDGATVREFDIELADGKPDFQVFSDVTPFKGQTLTLEAMLPQDSAALAAVVQADDVPDAAGLYREKDRPQFHFTARRGWLNDPNGLVYFDGEWHLFFQHNPYGWSWGNMHWGHAVSTDLVHWRELGEALYPRQYGDWCFSGSAFVLPAPGGGPSLGAAFTSTGRGECLTFSADRGRSWREPPGNPVVRHRGRDPRVFHHAPTQRWVMAVYDEEKGKAVAFYTSPDLKEWTLQSRIGDFYECPDLFELPVDGDPKDSRWVLYGADGRYVLGTFDGKQFTAEPGRHQLWYGQFYAAQTYSNAPDGRRVQIGWAQIPFMGMPFNQQMTVPCDLSLRTTADGVRLFAQPVPELDRLRQLAAVGRARLKPGEPHAARAGGPLLDVAATFVGRGARQFGLTVGGIPITYDVKRQTLSCGKHTAPLRLAGDGLRLRVLVDRGSVEVFAEDGRVALVAGPLPAATAAVEFFARGGEAEVAPYRIAAMGSAWPEEK